MNECSRKSPKDHRKEAHTRNRIKPKEKKRTLISNRDKLPWGKGGMAKRRGWAVGQPRSLLRFSPESKGELAKGNCRTEGQFKNQISSKTHGGGMELFG